jgi:hypothetical protein
MFDYYNVMDDYNEQLHEQIEQSLHMCAETDEEQNHSCSLESFEEDYDSNSLEDIYRQSGVH